MLAAPERISTAEYFRRYLVFAQGRVRSSTWVRYETLVRLHVDPVVGGIPLSRLRPVHIQEVMDIMVGKYLAPRTVVQAYRAISAALRQAVRWQLIAVDPPLLSAHRAPWASARTARTQTNSGRSSSSRMGRQSRGRLD